MFLITAIIYIYIYNKFLERQVLVGIFSIFNTVALEVYLALHF